MNTKQSISKKFWIGVFHRSIIALVFWFLITLVGIQCVDKRPEVPQENGHDFEVTFKKGD